jgi:hypothetical protein
LVEAGDCVHQRPGIVHSLYDWSDDMEFMEIIMPAISPQLRSRRRRSPRPRRPLRVAERVGGQSLA